MYNKEFLKTKIKSHGDKVTDLYDKKIPKGDSNPGQEKLGARSCRAPTVHLNYHLGERKNVYLVYLLHHKSYNQQYEKK